jgi:transport family protein 27
MESKEDIDDSINIAIVPDPFAPSDLTIDGIDESIFDTSHRSRVILREKVVVTGDSTVGKSALIKSLTSSGQEYPKKYLMTAGADMNEHSIPIPETNVTVDLFIYDLGGQSIFNQRGQMEGFWKDCTSIISVFDVSSRKSLQNCITRVQAIQTVAGRSRTDDDGPMPCLLVANKIDLRDNVSFCWNDVKSY